MWAISTRETIIVKPYERLNQDQTRALDSASMEILNEPGIWCFNERAAKLFGDHGAKVSEETDSQVTCWRVRLQEGLVREAIAAAPSRIVLGARNPDNRLLLDAEVPRVYFGTGSETNVWLETDLEEYQSVSGSGTTVKVPVHRQLRGDSKLLARAAHLCDRLEHLDFFIRPVNIQDEGVTPETHDVNKFFASLNNISKHVQAGLTHRDSLAHVVRMAEIIAGGKEELLANPIISFIACVFKSPLQLVDDTAEKVFSIVNTGLPLVISSSPQGGSTAPIQEAGMVAQINAEVLAGITFTQLIKPGAPVLYGSVPVRARMDDLHDMYGCPEFNQYNIDCVQMARHYKIPCYSTAGVGDAKVPGMQATFEKMLTHLYVAMSGAQYIHYAFGLLDRTSIFSPLQAILDNEQIGKVKHTLRDPKVDEGSIAEALNTVRKVMGSKTKLFARHARKAIHSGDVSEPFRFESKDSQDRVIERAIERQREIEAEPRCHLDEKTISRIYQEIPGLLEHLRQTNS